MAVSLKPDCEIVKKNKGKVKEWLRKYGFDPGEVYQIIIFNNENEMKAEIRRYKTDEEGKKFLNKNKDDVARQEPVTIDVDKYEISYLFREDDNN